jgi:hypothetical protein
MSATYSENTTHRANILAAEMTRQVAVAGAANQAAVRTAEIAFYRTCRTSAIANSCSPAQWISALQELGTGGG